jgi:hypothetical protein
MLLTTSALEQVTRPIVTALYPRRYALKNRERLNRLLRLQELHVNGEDDVQACAKTIRAWLEASGRPTAPRRAMADPLGSPSLRRHRPKEVSGLLVVVVPGEIVSAADWRLMVE